MYDDSLIRVTQSEPYMRMDEMKKKYICLGKQGESSGQVIFDVTSLYEQFGAGRVRIYALRPTEELVYPPDVVSKVVDPGYDTTTGKWYITWNISSYDTAFYGYGKVELVYQPYVTVEVEEDDTYHYEVKKDADGNPVISTDAKTKSITFPTMVIESFSMVEPDDTSWIDELMDLKDTIKTYVAVIDEKMAIIDEKVAQIDLAFQSAIKQSYIADSGNDWTTGTAEEVAALKKWYADHYAKYDAYETTKQDVLVDDDETASNLKKIKVGNTTAQSILQDAGIPSEIVIDQNFAKTVTISDDNNPSTASITGTVDSNNNIAIAIGNLLDNYADRESTIAELNELKTAKADRSELTNEINNRATADTLLQENINSEQTARESAVRGLQELITIESTTRDSKDTELSGKIDTINDTTIPNLRTELLGKIQDESDYRTDEDDELKDRIDAEKTARETEDTKLETSISDEVTRATNAETSLESKIDTDIATEKSARETKDTELNDMIVDEIADRQNEDTALQTKITEEETARESADTVLDTKIDTKINKIENTTRTVYKSSETMDIKGDSNTYLYDLRISDTESFQGGTICALEVEARLKTASPFIIADGVTTVDGKKVVTNISTDTITYARNNN